MGHILVITLRYMKESMKNVLFLYVFLFSYIFPFPCFPESYILATEDYPPFNMSKSVNNSNITGIEITGLSTDIVNELFNRAGIPIKLEIYPWKRAINLAEYKKGCGVYSTTRTPKREKRFKWVGPIVSHYWTLFTMRDSQITLQSLEDAKKFKIGGYNGDALTLFLEEQGIPVDAVPKDDLNIQKLFWGRIDLWVAGSLLGVYRAQNESIEIKAVLKFKKDFLWIAFNKETSSETIAHLNTLLKTMHKDGSITSFYKKYKFTQ